MPVLTREMIRQQQLARNAVRLPAPSTPSSHSSSPSSSLSSSPTSTSTFSHLSTPCSRDYSRSSKCWTSTLDEVSHADPDQHARLFARLTREKEYDTQTATTRTPERRVKTSTPRHSSAKPAGHLSVGIGAMALQLVRPGKEHPIEHPTLSPPGWDLDGSARMEIDDHQIFSECMADAPESPVTSSFMMGRSTVSEEVIAAWTREDEEMKTMEQEAKNNKLRQLGYNI